MESKPSGLYVDVTGSESNALLADLRAAGYAVTWLGDSRTVESYLARHACDFLLLRVEMPDLHGATLLARLRERGQQIPIILLSARIGAGERVRALNLGADDVVNTPLPRGEVLARVRALLRRSAIVGGYAQNL